MGPVPHRAAADPVPGVTPVPPVVARRDVAVAGPGSVRVGDADQHPHPVRDHDQQRPTVEDGRKAADDAGELPRYLFRGSAMGPPAFGSGMTSPPCC